MKLGAVGLELEANSEEYPELADSLSAYDSMLADEDAGVREVGEEREGEEERESER